MSGNMNKYNQVNTFIKVMSEKQLIELKRMSQAKKYFSMLAFIPDRARAIWRLLNGDLYAGL